jgi:predicted secreted protein/N-acetylneuraminic acid mutarotase
MSRNNRKTMNSREKGGQMKQLNCAKISFVLVGVVIIGLLSMTSVSLAEEDTWTRKADMPTARGYLATAVVNGKIYAMGGAFGMTSGSLAVEEYDPATNIWTRKANMPETRSAFSTSVIDGKVYVIGGAATPFGVLRSSIYVYDPATDTWTQKGQMLTPRVGLSAGVVDGKIYVIGGSSAGVGAYFKTVEMYDPVTNNWTRKADMPTARSDHRASVVDGKIYVIGGTTSSSWTGLSVVEVYDPAMDTWTRKADMPTPRWGLGVGEVNGKIYALGGASAPVWFSTVEQYDPSTNIWTIKTHMPTSRREFAVSVVDGKVYAIGGVSGNQGATYALATVEEYDTGFIVTPPSPDFNGDGVVDINDLVILIENWGTDEQLCDIAPPPDGDGVVDRLDLELFMTYWEQENFPNVNVDENDDGGKVTLKQGQNLVVTLESNPSTGYSWEVVEETNSILEQVGESEYIPPEQTDPPMVGSGGWEIFRFKAASPGQMTLDLVYRRSWETDAEPAKTFSIEVTAN